MLRPRISVVIPAFNEERFLPRLLDTIDVAKRRYRSMEDDVEVVVADNGSTDDTIAIAQSRGCKVVRVAPRIIGAVRNGGAATARAPLLAFVDADTQIHPETFNAIEKFFAAGKHVVGTSGAVPERRSLGIDVTWAVFGAITILAGYGMPRSRSQCVPTGVVCCRRDDWVAIGGYSERWRFAEDVWFLLELMKLGRLRRQRAGWLSGAPAIFSTRKFDEHGDWHYAAMPFRLIAMMFARGAVERWADRYWYGHQREKTPESRP
jgi:glycosyltransferase involved in cell wall biosynthesis